MIMERYSLKNKIALVTGSCGLLGREHCQALSEAGATVIVTDLDQELCRLVADDLPGQAFELTMNVSDQESVGKAFGIVMERYGKIDILVNNAAVNEKVEALDDSGENIFHENFDLKNWETQLRVNLTGVFICCKILGCKMAEQGYGSIINIASTYALYAPDQSLYCDSHGRQRFIKSPAYPVTKAAVLSLTRYLAAYWGRNGVRVNALSPGGVENGQEEWFISNYNKKTPLGRMAVPADYRGALVFLASEASSYMTGANLVIDGGWTIW
jgi:NAD(P)-dependent dehydrogenase (short-subunit alcohol dehydrogenase family)